MSKLSKLLVIGSGVAVANFYTKNPNKVDEHAGFIKKKAKRLLRLYSLYD